MRSKRTLSYAAGTLLALLCSLIAGKEVMDAVESGSAFSTYAAAHIIAGAVAGVLIYLIAVDYLGHRLKIPKHGKVTRILLGFFIVAFLLLSTGCATELLLKIEEGTPHLGNDIFHSVTGVLCIMCIAAFIKSLRW